MQEEVIIKKVGTPKKITYYKDKFLNSYPESVYWFGFLYADGCLIKTKSTTYIQLVLSNKDKKMVEKFVSYFEIQNTNIIDGYSKDGTSDKKHKQSKIVFSIDEDIEKYLSNFGIVKRKSLLNFYPKIINHDEILIKNFIRGYFDGDGGVSVYLKKNNRGNKYSEAISISWLGNEELLLWIQEKLKQYLQEDNLGKIGNRKSTFGFSIARHNLIKKFYFWLYTDNYFMKRKKDKIYNFLLKKGLI